jgi:DNA-binding transcriptional regulator YiaG
MRKSWRDIKDQTMTRKQQGRAHRLAMQDVREFELRELREALNVTQVMLAKQLKTTQAAISRLEKRPQMHVSTMQSYIEALGGQVHTFATFPNLPTVSLTQFFRKKPMAMYGRKLRAARRTGQRVARRIGQSRAAV